MEITFTLTDIHTIARELWELLPREKVFAFHGEMGAGKTTLINALCQAKQVKDVVGSPTFSLINEYESQGGTIYHIDLYRLKDEKEAIEAGIEDCLYSGEICLVEWPERAPAIFPADTVHLYLKAVNEKTRNLRIGDN